jgi:hypothetical protein
MISAAGGATAGSIGVLKMMTAITSVSNSATAVQSAAGPVDANGDVVQISSAATTLGGLFDAAGAYIKQEHLEPFTAYNHGNVSAGAYLNVKQYNDHLFDQAATTIVDSASKQGITLDAKDVVAKLRSDNKTISVLDQTQDSRVKNVGENSSFAKLTQSDVNGLTDLYIAAKDHGLPVSEIEGIAARKVIYKDAAGTFVPDKNHPGGLAGVSTLAEAYKAAPSNPLSENGQELVGLSATQKSVLHGYGIDDKMMFYMSVNSDESTGNAKTAGFLVQLAESVTGQSAPSTAPTHSASISLSGSNDSDQSMLVADTTPQATAQDDSDETAAVEGPDSSSTAQTVDTASVRRAVLRSYNIDSNFEAMLSTWSKADPAKKPGDDWLLSLILSTNAEPNSTADTLGKALNA